MTQQRARQKSAGSKTAGNKIAGQTSAGPAGAGQARAGAETRRAITEVAGRLFADRGFAAVTARDVAKEAGVALSAIPYHFGSMDALYREALLLACEVSPDAAPLAPRALLASPQDALRMAVRWAMTDLSAAAASWHCRLLLREEMDPSPAYKDVLSLKVVPEWNWLCEVVSRASGRPPASPEVKLGVIAMYSLTSSLLLQRGLVSHLAPDVAALLASKQEEHVECTARLTLAAVEAFTPRKRATRGDNSRPQRKGRRR